MNATRAWQRSRAVRLERARIRRHVESGGSLTLVLNEPREELDGVTLAHLVRWIPLVGDAKAQRILVGLPEREKISELNTDQYWLLVRRVRDAERHIIRRQLGMRE